MELHPLFHATKRYGIYAWTMLVLVPIQFSFALYSCTDSYLLINSAVLSFRPNDAAATLGD